MAFFAKIPLRSTDCSHPQLQKYSYDQSAMVVDNFKDQLRPDTFEFTLHHLIEDHIDLSFFYDQYSNEGGGRAAYDSAILLKIILFAYSKGVRFSRDIQIQWECEHNIIFKALSCDTVPHFTSIASFISGYPDAIESVFEQVLMVCDEQGLLGNELIAIDGCKMPSNAAKEHSGTFDELEANRVKIQRQIKVCMKQHKRLDRRKPKERERKDQLEQSINTLSKHADKILNHLKTAATRMGQGKRPKEIKSNITDNESGKMLTSKGTIQGYNGVAAVDKKHQIIVEAQAYGERQGHHTLRPMLASLNQRYRRAGIGDDILREHIIVTADTGFANEANYDYLKSEKINAYIPDNKFRSRDPEFARQKTTHGKRHRDSVKGIKLVIPARDFTFNAIKKRCMCPAGSRMCLKMKRKSRTEKESSFDWVFEGAADRPLLQALNRQFPIQPLGNDIAGFSSRTVAKEVTSNNNQKLIADIDSIPMPAWDLVDFERYRRYDHPGIITYFGKRKYAYLFTSRGCPYLCN